MIKLYTEQSYQQLYGHLLTLLIDNNSVFQETWIVVPNHSAKQWLQKSLAKSLGVCAQIKFIMPLSFNWEVLKNVVDSNNKVNVFSNDVLRWQIFQLINDSDDFRFLQQQSAIENFNLAEKISQTLLKYNDERPELINDWDNGIFNLKNEQEWQADLWIKLLSILDEESPVQLLQKFNAKTDFKQTPNKIILFSTEQLTTLQKDVILKLSEHKDIHLLLSNPSPDEYWYDIKPSATMARDKLFNTELAYLENVGNPLLANFGYNKMAIFDAFLNHDVEIVNQQTKEFNTTPSLLESIKQDIYHLSEQAENCLVDDSIKIHSCHNCLREVEVVKDEILYLLDNNSTLNPEDIIVVAPDINDYVFAIKDVFQYNEEGNNPYVPFHIDRVQLADNDYITSLMNLLHSIAGEMTAPVIYELLSQSVILDKFNILEDELPRIKNWIIDSNIRNFYSAAQKNELGFENKIGNTWNFGENRWLSGYLAGESDDSPYLSSFGDIAGQESLFSNCFSFLKLWFKAYKESQNSKTPQDWYIFIKNLCRDFLYNDFDTDFEKQITQQLEKKFFQQTLNIQIDIPLNIINSIVEATITENTYRSEGQIGIRFQTWENAFVTDAKILIIMGLNDGEFPQKQIKSDLDVFNNISPRLNKSTRQRDKNLMLTALTENVEKLIMTYIGFNKTNDTQPPSVILADIISYLQSKTNNEFKVKIHKMHGYNQQYFSDKLSSYSHKNYQLAQSFYNKKSVSADKNTLLNLETELSISLNDLAKFFSDPLEFFLKNRAKITHPIYEDMLQDTETYYPTGLETWALKNKIFQYGETAAAKTGIVSDNKLGQSVLKKYNNELQQVLTLSKEIELHTHIVEFEIAEHTIFGKIQVDDKKNLISLYPNKMKAKDICQHWIKHLCYKPQQTSYAYFEDKSISFEPIENSIELLTGIFKKWQQSFNQAWLFCPNKIINAKNKNMSVLAKPAYLKTFIETDNNFPSEGQKYFAKQVEQYNEENDIKQFIQPIIENIKVDNANI